ncbi:MAG: NTP transferase domain-containing protein, partial [Endomicrobium sp.]|nr:NTP transferase domain-containing protein [Endomicrobium sp.]
MKGFSAVILAAGAGTRMKSALPKVMHKLSGKPLIGWVIDSVSALKPDNIVVVLGHKADIVEEYLKDFNVKIVYQKEQFGSGHALLQAAPALKNYKGDILVLSADVPLVKTSTLSALLKQNKKTKSAVTVLAAKTQDPFGYGRIVRTANSLEKIVEEKDASPQEKLIKEINGGIYCFGSGIWKALLKIKPDNAKKEYYLTDAVEILKKSGGKAGLILINESYEVKGINNRKELADAQTYVLRQKIKELFENGVTVISPENVYVSKDAKIGADTVIYPGAFIDCGVIIGKHCIIKGSSCISNSKVGDGSVISYSYVNGALIGKNVKIGPFA